MMCVTPADLGKPIAAIVQRCGAPDAVMSLGMSNQLLYAGAAGTSTTVFFDAEQMRARILQFTSAPPEPSQPVPAWSVTLPFESGARAIVLGTTTVAEAQRTLAADADVTTENGAAFRSTVASDVVLAGASTGQIVSAAFVGERAALVQMGIIASPVDRAPLDYLSPMPRERALRFGTGSGSHSTIVRIDVDAAGVARNVTIVVASGDDAFDAAMQRRLGDETFRPATLDHRRVAGTSFVQVRH